MGAPVVFRLDASRARVGFSVRWFKVIRVRGTFGVVSGVVTIPGANGDEADVVLEVDSASVRTGIALRDHHLSGMRFLDSGKHPRIRFESDHVTRHNGVWDVRGRLLLRGCARDVRASVFDEVAPGPDHRLTAEFTVPRRPHAVGTAHGIRALNPLLWAIGDDVTVHVELLVPATMLHPTAEAVRAR